jgi:hypothetical protein
MTPDPSEYAARLEGPGSCFFKRDAASFGERIVDVLSGMKRRSGGMD